MRNTLKRKKRANESSLSKKNFREHPLAEKLYKNIYEYNLREEAYKTALEIYINLLQAPVDLKKTPKQQKTGI